MISPLERIPVATRLPARNSALCTSAALRLIWAVGALLVLWTTVLWALD